MSAPKRTPKQSGFVLIFALWILAGCALLLASYAKSATRPPVALATYPLRQSALESAAEFFARNFDHERAKQNLKVGEHEYRVLVTPVSGKPNINTLSAQALRSALLSLGLTEQKAGTLTESLRHWRGDADVPTAGHFEDEYRSATHPYRKPGRAIKEWSELTYLSGSAPDLVDFLRRHFSLEGDDTSVVISLSESNQAISLIHNVTSHTLDDIWIGQAPILPLE